MTFWAAGAIAVGTIGGSLISADAAGKASRAQSDAASEAADLQYKVSQDQLAAQKEALDKQIAASGVTVDKQLLAQRDALNEQMALQQRMYDQTRADFAPYRDSGTANLNQLNTLLGLGGNTNAADFGRYKTAEFTPEMFKAGVDPGYAFRLSEGLKGIDRSAAARGRLISGNALKAASGYAGDQASQEFQNAYNRYQTTRGNTLQPFQSGAAAGQSAAAMQGQANTNFGSAGGQAIGQFGQGASTAYGNMGNSLNTAYGNFGQGTTGILGAYGQGASESLLGGANARASGYIGGANAITGGISGLSNAYYQNQLLKSLDSRQNVPAMSTNYYASLGNPFGYGSMSGGGSPNG